MASMPVVPKHTRRWLLLSLGTLFVLAVAVAVWPSRRALPEREIERTGPAPDVVATDPSEPSPENRMASEEECVLVRDLLENTIIPYSYARNDRKGVIVLQALSTGTIGAKDAKRILKEARPGITPEIVQEFLNLDSSPKRWPNSLNLSRPYRLVEAPTLNAISEDGGWERMKREVPGACEVVSISRPAFSSDRKTALIFYDYVQGQLSGGGGVVLMQKRVDGWHLKDWVIARAY